MPRDDLHELVCLARQVFHPLREAEMELRALPLRHLAVGDVAHQDVVERVLLVVLDGGDLQVGDEVAPLELRGPGCGSSGAASVCGAETGDRAGPEDRANNRSMVGELLLLSLQPVEA